MAKREGINKIMVIGSGPIVIGQAAEFDYAGTQACIALREEGYRVVLVNSNPATIMTDTNMADKVYLEPLDLEHVARIIRSERPDGIICGLGGQTGLNLGMQLYKKGILEECQVKVLGTSIESIEKAEDRKLFKQFCESIGEPAVESCIATSVEQAFEAARGIGFPVVLRPAFTLGGTGGGFAENEEQFSALIENALKLSPVGQVLVEKSVKGYKEIEFEVVRDAEDNVVVVAGMENIDPVGVHTGDSIVVAPTQTLSAEELEMLRNSAIKIVRGLGIEGGCNVQFALRPDWCEGKDYYLIEVNPRLSRSSALASKATAFPIASVATKIACGLSLPEIMIAGVPASSEPVVDYVIAKFPRFPFDKFTSADRRLSTQMKATGEVMSIGRSIEEAILKAVRSLELGVCHVGTRALCDLSKEEILQFIARETDERIFAIAEAFRKGADVKTICDITKIDKFFCEKILNIVEVEKGLRRGEVESLKKAKGLGFSDEFIGQLWGMSQFDVYNLRKEHNIFPAFLKVNERVPYFYSSYQGENQSERSARKKIIVLGSGPVRIGQGVEFDYSTVHAVWAIREMGYEAIIINNNPETVSTDHTLGDKLYFEPLAFEDVMNVIHFEQADGVICALGGQTAINLAEDLDRAGVKILGSSCRTIALAEDRDLFAESMEKLGIPMPAGRAVCKTEDAKKAASEIGYPVLVRPSFVLGGRMMHIVADEKALVKCVHEAIKLNPRHPVLVDKYISGKECEVDAVCDGKSVFIPGIMEHIERAGVHSGDSMSVYPTFSVSSLVQKKIVEYTRKIGLGLGIIGPYNIQFVVDGADQKVYVIEVNPRSSRTVPFIAKVTGAPLANIATKVMIGSSLKELGYEGTLPARGKWFVKTPTFSFSKLAGLDAVLSPEMKSTGEAIGYDKTLARAVYKSLKAAGINMVNYGTIFVTVAGSDKEAVFPLVKRFYDLGFNIVATKGTAQFLKDRGVRTRVLKRISEGSDEILKLLRSGYVAYVINTSNRSVRETTDGARIRWTAVENKIPVFTCLDTVKILLDVLEDVTMGVSTIDA